jgi:hypothetical protein
MKMLLEVEKKQAVQVSEFSKVEKALRSLKSYGPHSFASLTRHDDSYVQVAGGRVTCILEMRDQQNGIHWRAYLNNPRVPYEGQQTLMFGGGHMTMEADEVLFIDDVITAFRAFFDDSPYPDELKWRDMSHVFDG